METYQIVLIVLAVIIGACAAFYSAMKIMEKKADAKREVKISNMPNVTLSYVKDWIKVEIAEHKERSVGIMLAEKVQALEDCIIPEELKDDSEHVLVLIAREKDKIYKIRMLHFETLDKNLSDMLEQSNGVFNLTN